MLVVSGEEAVPVNISNFVIHDLKIGDYVACSYDFDWYAAIILDISIDNGYVYVNSGTQNVLPSFLKLVSAIFYQVFTFH